MLQPTAPGFSNSWKTDPVAIEPSKPTEVSMLIYTVGFKLGFKASNREGGTSLYLSRQRVHNTVGSLPLAKNALHSLTSSIRGVVKCMA